MESKTDRIKKYAKRLGNKYGTSLQSRQIRVVLEMLGDLCDRNNLCIPFKWENED